MALSLSSALLAAAPSAPLAFAPSPEGEGGNPLIGLLPLVLIMVIFYLLVIRPQQKRYKDHQKMVQALGRGDRILTNGGLYATVQDVKDDMLVCQIADGVKVEVAKNSVSSRVAAMGAAKDDDGKSGKSSKK